MSYSFTQTETSTFTVTHARHMAAKVAADLKRVQRFYGKPDDAEIAAFEIELIELMKEGYLKNISYGFKREGQWIAPTLIYSAQELSGGGAVDDDPGRVPADANVAGATFYSYLKYGAAWDRATPAQRAAFKRRLLPFERAGAEEPGVNGYVSEDRAYSAGGRVLKRSSVRSFG
jgi:hypothetical protein